MQFKDYYQTLGVARDATAEDIKKAFRKLARKYHPDVSKEPDAELRMKEVNEAHAVLSDPEKRAAYDQLGRNYQPGQDFRPPPDWDAGFEFSGRGLTPHEAADFSDFFSELFGRMGGGGFHDARGHARGEDHHAKVMLDLEDAFHGAGDLLLEVHFRPHQRLRAEGRDLHLTLPLAPWEAALGAIVAVDLPDGGVKVRIPEGAQSGRQLRVRGKGIPGEPPGDLLLELQVVLPPADTPKARRFYETMATEFAFDPRGRA